MLGWFTRPNSHAGEYIRNLENFEFDGTKDFPLTVNSGVGPIELVGPGNVVKLTLPGTNVIVKANTFPDGGHFYATAPGCEPVAFNIRMPGKLLRGPKVPLCQASMLSEAKFDSAGMYWVDYKDDPLPLPKGCRVAPRPYAEWDFIPNTDATRKQIISEPLVAADGIWGFPLRRWNENEHGNISIGYYQQYFRSSVQTLATGNLRDGPYGVGETGTVVGIRQRKTDGALLTTAINGKISWVFIEDDRRVETAWGIRLKPHKPVPRLTANTTLTAAQKTAFFMQFYEYVGGKLLDPWFALPDYHNHDRVWILNTNMHHILHVDTKTLTVLACIGAPDGAMGFRDGVGELVLMRRPRGADYVPGTNGKYILYDEAWNGAFRLLNTQTYAVETVFRSRLNWDNSPYVDAAGKRNTLGTNFHGIPVADIRTVWSQPGGDGEGCILHPQQGAFMSNGVDYVTASDHSRDGFKFNLDRREISKLFDVAESIGGFVEQSQRHTGWVSLDVNSQGKGAMKDLICYADWGGTTVYKPDGTGAFFPDRDPARKGNVFGTMDRQSVYGYQWGNGWAPKSGGALVRSDAGSERMTMLSRRVPEDFDLSDADFLAGAAVWTTPIEGNLPPAVLYDDYGFSKIGVIQLQEMATWSDFEIESWVEAGWPYFTDEQIKAARRYIRYCQLRPLIVSGDERSLVLDATVTNATSLTLDGAPVILPAARTITMDKTFVLRADGPGGTAVAALDVKVKP